MTTEIGIVFGSTNTAIYVPGTGIALFEPSVIVLNGGPESLKVKAVGREAAEMRGKLSGHFSFVRPVEQGVIKNISACYLMIKGFLSGLFELKKTKIKAIVGVPVGLTVEERKAYEDCCNLAGISDCTLIENVILSAVGIDLPIHEARCNLIVNIGGGTTEIAAISLSSIVNAVNINIGGDMIDNSIYDSLIGTKNIKCGINTIRKIKNNVASLYKNDISSYTAYGIDPYTASPAKVTVEASDIIGNVMAYYLRIADSVNVVIRELKPELVANLIKSSIHIVGGSSKIAGLSDLMYDKTGVETIVYEDAIYANILGAGKLLSNPVLLKDILMMK